MTPREQFIAELKQLAHWAREDRRPGTAIGIEHAIKHLSTEGGIDELRKHREAMQRYNQQTILDGG